MTTFVVKDAFVKILTDKEVRRQRFLSRVRDHRRRVRRMREIAVKAGLCAGLWPGEKEATWNPYPPGRRDRATGRTTRMLLSAAVDVLDGHPVVICAHQTDYAKELCVRLGAWLHRTKEMPEDVFFVSRMVKWKPLSSEPIEFQGFSKDTRFYCDHFASYTPDLRLIGREWSEAPTHP